MHPCRATVDVIGVDKKVVEDDQSLERVCGWERSCQHAKRTQTDLDGSVEW